jgi:sugar lactone lactonase YvrE
VAPVQTAELTFIGANLEIPECVLATKTGDLFTSDGAGVAHIRPDGSVRRIKPRSAPDGFRTNGFAMLPDRSFLIANLGPNGGIWRLTDGGELSPFLTSVDGVTLPSANYVGLDEQGRLWITVSTRQVPRHKAWRKDCADGFIVLYDKGAARIVADDLRYTNEAIVDQTGKWLYVCESFAQQLVRYDIAADGSLGPKEIISQFSIGSTADKASVPDGLAMDEEGYVWIANAFSNRLVRIDPKTGNREAILEDAELGELAQIADHLANGEHQQAFEIGGRRALGNLSSLAFGGEDLRTIYLGGLSATRIGCLRTPFKGYPRPHWSF